MVFLPARQYLPESSFISFVLIADTLCRDRFKIGAGYFLPGAWGYPPAL